MTTRNELDRSISAWLVAEAPDRAPDDVLDASREQIRNTRQRRAWLPARRSSPMNNPVRIAIAAAAVLVVALIGYQLLPSNTSGPGGRPTATPAATPEPTGVPRLPAAGPVEAGTYRIESGPTFLITVPAGWDSTGLGVRKHDQEPNELAFDVWSSEVQVFADACQSEGTEKPIGPTAADLLAALRAQGNSQLADPEDITVGGLPGMRLNVSAPAGLDLTNCSIGTLQFWVAEEGGYLAGVGDSGDEDNVVYVADAPGGRLIYGFHHGLAATPADIAELDAIVASIEVVE